MDKVSKLLNAVYWVDFLFFYTNSIFIQHTDASNIIIVLNNILPEENLKSNVENIKSQGQFNLHLPIHFIIKYSDSNKQTNRKETSHFYSSN